MVDLKAPYELNHVYHVAINSLELPVGDSEESEDVELELFEKSLALASDLKRLPILRSLSKIPFLNIQIKSDMQGSTVNAVQLRIKIYDSEKDDDDDNLIWSGSMNCWFDSGAATFESEIPPDSWDFEGGRLLGHKIIIESTIQASSNPATNPFPAGNLNFDLFFEIDWYPVKKPELDDFIREHLYARMGD